MTALSVPTTRRRALPPWLSTADPMVGSLSNAGFVRIAIAVIVGMAYLTPLGQLVFSFGGLFVAEPCVALLLYLCLRGRRLSVPPAGLFALMVFMILIVAQAAYGVPIIAGYGDMRALICLVLAAIATRRLLQTPAGESLIAGALCGGALFSVFALLTKARGASQAVLGSDVKTVVALNIGPGLVLFAIRARRPAYAIVGAAFAAFAAILSGYRLSIIVAVWVGVVAVFAVLFAGASTSSRQAGATIVRRLLTAAASGFVLYQLSVYLFRRFVESNPVYYKQITVKLQQLSEALAGIAPPNLGDQVRVDLLSAVLQSPGSYLLPHGLGTRYWYGRVPTLIPSLRVQANTIDSGVFFLAFHFGLLLAAVIGAVLLAGILKYLARAKPADRVIVLLGVPLLITEFVISADTAVVWVPALATGLFIGLMLGRSSEVAR